MTVWIRGGATKRYKCRLYTRSVVPKTVKVALFADDVSIISSHHNEIVAEKDLRRADTTVAEWRNFKKMVLNADKCKVAFFSTNSHEAN